MTSVWSFLWSGRVPGGSFTDFVLGGVSPGCTGGCTTKPFCQRHVLVPPLHPSLLGAQSKLGCLRCVLVLGTAAGPGELQKKQLAHTHCVVKSKIQLL